MSKQYTKRIDEVIAKRKTNLEGTIIRTYYGNNFMVLLYDDGTYVHICAAHGYDDDIGLNLNAQLDPPEMLYAGLITTTELNEYGEKVLKDRAQHERKEWERLNAIYGKRP